MDGREEEETVEGFVCACATDNGVDLVDRHFGDAERYEIYTYKNGDFVRTGAVENTVPDESAHGAGVKARNIGSLLREHGVHVLVSRQFGPNLLKVRRVFVPVIARVWRIEEALALIELHEEKIELEYAKGEERSHLVLRPEK